MNVFLQIWRNIPSIIAIMLPLFIDHFLVADGKVKAAQRVKGREDLGAQRPGHGPRRRRRCQIENVLIGKSHGFTPCDRRSADFAPGRSRIPDS